MYRYDNFANTAWQDVDTYPRHFHDGSQSNVRFAQFDEDLLTGFRQFMNFVRDNLG
jgi:hypothetical protein